MYCCCIFCLPEREADMAPPEGSLALRRRSGWEAADSGVLLWRDNAAWFLIFFALPFWVCAFVLRMLPGRAENVSLVLLWWFKPLFDRLVLHVIAARFFAGASGGHLCRGLGRNVLRGLFGDLLWRRFSPLRAAMLPVRMLEHLPFRKIGERRRALQKGGLGFCWLLTLWGMALQTVLLCGELLFVLVMQEMIQPGSGFSLDVFSRYFTNNTSLLFFSLWCFNYMLVESLYVCMGFGVYLNSRFEAEGWDIEILLRSFAEKAKKRALPSVALALLIAAGLSAPVQTFAESGEFNNTDIPLETLDTVLASPEFGGEREGWGIRWKNPGEPRKTDFDLAPWVETVRQAFALALRLFLFALAAAFIVFLVFQAIKWRETKRFPKDHWLATSAGAAKEEDPAALLEKARVFFNAGETRAAWAWCIAALIRAWPRYRGVFFPPHATEYECAEIAGKSAPAQNGAEDTARRFSESVRHWVNFAYGGRMPPEGSFEAAAALCEHLGVPHG